MQRARTWRAAAVGVAAAALMAGLAACGTTPVSTGPAPTTVTLVGGIQSQPDWWFPITPVSFNSVANDATGLMYKSLLWISANATINFSRSLADRITPSHDDTVFTIQLNPKWHWSNGTPVTAADCAYAWAIYHASGQPNAPWINSSMGSSSFDAIKSVTAAGRYTVVVTLNKPYNPTWVELDVLNYASPIPKAVWDKYSNMRQELEWLYSVGDKPNLPEFRVVDGPYDVQTVVNDEYWTLVANPHYSGHKAAVKKLIYEYETSADNVFVGLRKGVYGTASLPSSFVAAARQLKGYAIKVRPYEYSFDMIQPNFWPNAAVIGGLFNQLYFREAMQLGINERAIIKSFYHGYAAYECTAAAPAPKNSVYDPNTCKVFPGFNPARGRALLEAHGWHLVNGVMERHGVRLAFTMPYQAGSNTDTLIAEYLKSTWAEEGIDVTLEPVPFAQLITLVTTPSDRGKWTLVWWGGGWTQGEGYPDLSLYKCNSANDFGGYCSATLDHLIAQVYAPGTPAQAQQRLDAYEMYVAQNLPVLFMPDYIGSGISPAPYQAVKTWLHGWAKWHLPVYGGSEPWRWTTTPAVT
jgi:peptide/nickel transport system substrate-binding protein